MTEITEKKDTTNDKPQQSKQHHQRNVKKSTNIILVGLSGSGKTSIGKMLAYHLGYGFLDLDKKVEELTKKKIAELFISEGEDFFRKKETFALSQLPNICNHVISLGGGSVMAQENWKMMEALGTIVWLNVPTFIISRRFFSKKEEIKDRPILSRMLDPKLSPAEQLALIEKKLNEQLEERLFRYKKAKINFQDSYSCQEECANRIKYLLFAKNPKRDDLLQEQQIH